MCHLGEIKYITRVQGYFGQLERQWETTAPYNSEKGRGEVKDCEERKINPKFCPIAFFFFFGGLSCLYTLENLPNGHLPYGKKVITNP